MRKGFTLMELIVVVIIIGILAMIGLPQFFKVAERGRAAEALTALGALRNAQLRFAAETPDGQTTDAIANLDLQITTPGKFFEYELVSGVVPADTANAGTAIAQATRLADTGFGTYVITIAVDGTIGCSGDSNDFCNVITRGQP